MSVAIVGGNECMTRQYIDLAKNYKCKAKVYAKMRDGLKNLGSPDLIILFTSTMSHKMMHMAVTEAKKKNLKIVRSHTSSMNALKNILEEHTQKEN